MSASLQSLAGRFIRERHRLGFLERNSAVPGFARHVDSMRIRRPLTVEVMADWARLDKGGSNDPHTWARRLKKLRTFLRWLRQFEPRTEVPDDAIFGRIPERYAPHIYTEQELADLLVAARCLLPKLRGAVYEALFGLVACAGLRISEALALTLADVDLRSGLLIIRRSKFGKSRQVPLHPSAIDALRRYRRIRDQHIGAAPDSLLFVTTRGRRLGQAISGRQPKRIFAELRTKLGWRNRGAHHAPRIHDLRHTFVVRRIVLWLQQGVDIDQMMLPLATYVGHTNITNTYWYLSAVPELLAVAGRRFEAFKRREVAHA